ncbi:MAG: LytR/AlgR family response regulator transcription factor [Putridiphycobacter sp.]
MNLKVLVVEDEFTIALDIEQRLSSMGFEVVGVAVNYNEALPYLLEDKIDIVLLDINLEDEKSGIDLAKLIKTKFNLPVVFLTAYTDEATFNKASEASPMGYLNKPFKDTDIKHTLKLAYDQFKMLHQTNSTAIIPKEEDAIFVKDKGQLIKVNIEDILWVEAMDNYTVLYFKDSKIVANAFLKDMLETLGNRFLRIHRSHAIALNKIDSIDDNLVFIGTKALTVSKSHKQELLDKLKLI